MYGLDSRVHGFENSNPSSEPNHIGFGRVSLGSIRTMKKFEKIGLGWFGSVRVHGLPEPVNTPNYKVTNIMPPSHDHVALTQPTREIFFHVSGTHYHHLLSPFPFPFLFPHPTLPLSLSPSSPLLPFLIMWVGIITGIVILKALFISYLATLFLFEVIFSLHILEL